MMTIRWRWSTVFLGLMLGVSLYTNWELLGKYGDCLSPDIAGKVEQRHKVEQYRVSLISTAQAKELPSSSSYEEYADSISVVYELPPGLLKSICYTESHWINGQRGAAGEIGLCQLKLDTVLKFCPKCANSPGTIYLTLGSKGELVKKIQHRFGLLGTGEFDYLLEGRIVEYQTAHKLRVDGIVGPVTWKALFGEILPGGKSLEERMWSPLVNINYAAQYLEWLRIQLKTNDPMILAAAYNGGNNNMTVRYMKLIEAQLKNE